MKIKLIILSIFFSTSLKAQRNLPGKYCDYFGSCLEIKADSTFKFTIYPTDNRYYWFAGIWKIEKNILSFHNIPIYDTIVINNKDSLVLAPVEISRKIIEPKSIQLSNQTPDSQLANLYFKKGKLYKIENGKLVRKKIENIYFKKYFPQYFLKMEE